MASVIQKKKKGYVWTEELIHVFYPRFFTFLQLPELNNTINVEAGVRCYVYFLEVEDYDWPYKQYDVLEIDLIDLMVMFDLHLNLEKLEDRQRYYDIDGRAVDFLYFEEGEEFFGWDYLMMGTGVPNGFINGSYSDDEYYSDYDSDGNPVDLEAWVEPLRPVIRVPWMYFWLWSFFCRSFNVGALWWDSAYYDYLTLVFG